MISVREAERIVASYVKDFGVVSCPLTDSRGRILRETIRADRDYPPFDRATVDGIGVSARALAARRRAFRVEYTLQAGRPSRKLKDPDGGCIRIMTGAVVPPGIEQIIPIEWVTVSQSTATLSEGFPDNRNIHACGSDAKKNDILLHPGCRLTGPKLAVIASMGRASIRVAYVPSVAVISTGDELVDVGRPIKPWQIRRSNAYAIRASLQVAGYGEIGVFHVKDKRSAVLDVFAKALRAYDVVIATGGVSMGDYDFVPGVLRELKIRKLFHKVSQRPGKPFWFGMSRKKQPVFALPGNPVSTMVCLHRYVLPNLARAMGLKTEPIPSATLLRSHAPHAHLTLFLPVHIESKGNQLFAEPERYGGSGDLVALSTSDGFIELAPRKRPYPAGTTAIYRRWV